MNTYFAYDVQTSDKKRSLVMSSGNTLEECQEKAIKDVNYYITECNYEVVIEIEERCSECHNQGFVSQILNAFRSINDNHYILPGIDESLVLSIVLDLTRVYKSDILSRLH